MALRKLGPTPKTSVVPQQAKKVLYVEDEDLNWEVTELSLKKACSIERASNARQAYEKIVSTPFDLILMDIQLAGSDMDGIGLTRLLKGKDEANKRPLWAASYKPSPSLAPIVFVTAYSALYPGDALLQVGAVEVVHKPVDFARLLMLITKLTLNGSLDGREWTRTL